MALAIGERYAERRELKPRVFRWLVWKKILQLLKVVHHPLEAFVLAFRKAPVGACWRDVADLRS